VLIMEKSYSASSSLPNPMERLQASLARSIERSGPNSLYSRVLKAEIARYQEKLQSRPQGREAPWTVAGRG